MKLKDFCINHSLILINQLNDWRAVDKDAPLETHLVKNFIDIQEERWAEEISNLQGAPPFFPTHIHCPVSHSACSIKGNELRHKYHAIVLQDNPVVVIGLINPYLTDDLRNALNIAFPGKIVKIVCISPHAFARLASFAERSQADFLDWDENYETWAKNCGFNSDLYINTNDFVEELWKNGMVSTKNQFNKALPLKEGGCEILNVFKTATHSWYLVNHNDYETLNDKLIQKYGLKPHFIYTQISEIERLKKVTSKTEHIDEKMPLNVSKWVATEGSEIIQEIIAAAVHMQASDIHIEPKDGFGSQEGKIRVRFRVDGTLHQQAPLNIQVYASLLRRLKIQANMRQDDIGEIQDGAGYQFVDGLRYDLRYHVTVVNGQKEAIVIRIFNSRIPTMSDLAFDIEMVKVLNWFLAQESGMLISSGPTGSGKTTTLYSLLSEIAEPSISLLTIESPVEKYFEEAKQISVKEHGNLTFNTALRSAMRQDPDVIMIGEVRDEDSCHISMQAASTGHLVLTTTHSNDAVGVIERLCGSFHADRVALAYSLKLALAQRLVPRLCPFCKKTREPKAEDLEYFPDIKIAKPVICEKVGCSACRRTGIIGRIAMLEMLPIDDTVAELIIKNEPLTKIAEYNKSRGFKNLMDQATRLLLTGEMDIETARWFIKKPLI